MLFYQIIKLRYSIIYKYRLSHSIKKKFSQELIFADLSICHGENINSNLSQQA